MSTPMRKFKIYYPCHEILVISATSREAAERIAFDQIVSTKPKAQIKYMSVVEVRS